MRHLPKTQRGASAIVTIIVLAILGYGVYLVSVIASDGMGGSVADTFFWTITNPAPDAVSDGYSTSEDTPVSGDVSLNDNDLDGDTVVFNQLTNPADGSVVFNPDGTFTYTPDPDFTGNDSFDYEIIDLDGASSTATVSISVGDVNDPPQVTSAIPDQANLDSDIVNLDVSNHFNDVEGDSLMFSVSGLPAGLAISTDGLITGTVDASASQGGPTANGIYAVIVTVDDGNGGSVSDSFTWTIGNPAPTATNNMTSVTEDTNEVGIGNVITGDSGSGVDTDPDGDSLAVTAINGNSADVGMSVDGAYGTVSINSDGSYEYSLDSSHSAVTSLDNGETLTESFGYTISDGEGGFSSATLTITINGTNDAPQSTNIPDQANLDDDTASFNVASFFSDDESDPLSFAVSGLPSGLTIDANTGEISGTIARNASQGGPLADGEYVVTVTATDDSGLAVSSSFNWTVDNPAPVANDDTFSTNEDTPFSASVSGNDSDADNDIVSYSITSGPGNGVLTFAPDGSFTYQPNTDYFGPDSFIYEICDADGDCSVATVTITVVSVNDAPVLVSTIPDRSSVDGELVNIDLAGHFNDVDGNISFSATGLPTGLSINGSGNISGTLDTSASSNGPFTVVVTAEDVYGDTVTDTFTWTVTNPGPNAAADSFGYRP